MRYVLVVLLVLFGMVSPAAAQVSISIGTPNLSIGINVPVYPEFVRVPGYPVYYATNLRENYFFYDDAYWVFNDGRWYVSTGYNGPWAYVTPYDVPAYILRVPVRYYRQPPRYFHDWRRNEAPRWGQRWGHEWERRRAGWDDRDRRATPAEPRPRYEPRYAGERFQNVEARQRDAEDRHYGHASRDGNRRQRYQARDQHRDQWDSHSRDGGGWTGPDSGRGHGHWSHRP